MNASYIDISPIPYHFKTKPLLIGGAAKEYYGIRPAGRDIDLVVTREDYNALALMFPQHLKDLYGDLGVIVNGFEIWTSICLFDYAMLSEHAAELPHYLVISREKLLFLTALAIQVPKYEADLKLIVDAILKEQYKDYSKK